MKVLVPKAALTDVEPKFYAHYMNMTLSIEANELT